MANDVIISYEVWMLMDVDILSNMLMALAKYRAIHKGWWPTVLVVSHSTKLSITYGSDIRTKHEDWPMMDTLYLSTHKPVEEAEPHKRIPTCFNGIRQPVNDVNRVMYRDRTDNQGILLTISQEG